MNNYFLNESMLFEQQNVLIASVFNKIDIYNARKDKWLAEGRYNEIVFTTNERNAINDMIRLIEQNLIINYYNTLNEGFGDIKSKITAGIDKLKSLPANIRTAYDFCEKIINKGVSKVSELIKFFIELLQKLGDTMRDAIMKLGGFGKSEIKEKSDNNPYSQYGTDELKFLQCVDEYVAKRQNNKDFLNEGAFDKLLDKVLNNKFLQVIICGTYNGEKLSWWKSLLVSITGSIIINVGVGILCSIIGIAAQPTAAIVLAFWSLRSIIRVVLNRRAEMKKTGESKFWNVSVVLHILLTVGTYAFFQIPCVKEFIANIVNNILNNASDIIKDKVNYLIEHFAGKQSKVEDIQLVLTETANNTAATSVSVNDDVLTKNVDNFQDKVQEFVHDGELTQQMRNLGRVWSNKLEELFPVTDSNPADSAFVNAHGFKDVGGGFHEGGGGKDGFIQALADKGYKAIFCDKENVGGWIIQKLDGSNLVSADTDAINSVTKVFADAGGLHNYSPAHLLHITEIAEPIVEPEDIVEPVVTGFDVAPYFGGFAFVSKFANGDLANRIKISFGSEAANNKFFKVSKINEIPLESVNKELTDLGINANSDGVKQLIARDKDNKKYVNSIAELTIKSDIKEASGDNNSNEAEQEFEKIVNVNNSADPNKDKCLVFYTKVDNNGKDMDLPIVAINYRTMYAVDLIKSKQLKTRKNPYFLKGLFNHLTIKPISNKDAEAQAELYKLLLKVLIGSVKGNAILCQLTIGTVKHLAKKQEWVAKSADNDVQRLELGNFTNNEVCDILNNPNDAFKYFNGEYASQITKTDDKGNVIDAKKREGIIEDKYEYVKTRFIPVITCKDTNVFKALANDDDVSDVFMKNGDWKTDDDGNLLILQKDIAESIMRSPETFKKDTHISLTDYIKGLFSKKSKDKNKVKRLASAIHMLSAIIWDFAGDRKIWKKEVEIANKSNKDKASIPWETLAEIAIDDDTKTKALEITDENNKKSEESHKQYSEQEQWFNSEILPKITKDSDVYKLIKSKAFLRKHYIKNDELNKDAIRDKYLVAALYTHKDDFSEEITDKTWKKILDAIERESRKAKRTAKKLAKTRIRRIIALYLAITKQLKTSDNSETPDLNIDFDFSLD